MCIPTCCRCTTPSANTFLFVFQWLVSGLSLSPSFSFPSPVFNRSCFFFVSYFCFITQLDEHEAQHTINCIEFIALRGDEIVLKTAITLSTFPLFRAAIIYPCVLSAFCLCVFFFFLYLADFFRSRDRRAWYANQDMPVLVWNFIKFNHFVAIEVTKLSRTNTSPWSDAAANYDET